MKNILFIACCCVMVLGGNSCGTSGNIEKNTEVEEMNNKNAGSAIGGVQIANPYYNFNSLEEAAEMAGFSIVLPDAEYLPDWIIRTDYRATKENLMEIIYPGDENYEREIRFRKAITDREDMSGDYRSYDKEEKIDVGGKSVTVRINGDKIYGAIWRDGEFAYSVHVSDGMNRDELIKIIEIIK